ncbi:MAG TPA: hypothetical protein IAB00_07065 [Candidatus Avidehalobacter gallistercoris]|uniref:Uncharacterized protein n=1 Tax=Candidatus Avidehalobacter gallistercoris TaxID=2840694 RepID=A0A9D1HKK7_9FIRM|nr:hypothetical protein [Candidatus Avidehalobacter gallistercoris]
MSREFPGRFFNKNDAPPRGGGKEGIVMLSPETLSAEAIWRLFEETGSPSAYMCYCSVCQKQ